MAFISSEGVTCPDHGTTKLSLSAGICLWGYSFLKLQLFLKAILCLWTWQGSIMWWLGERIRIAMWVSKCPFDLVTRKEPFEKIIQSRINFRNWNCQQKKNFFQNVRSHPLASNHSAFSSSYWMTGDLDPSSLGRRKPCSLFAWRQGACPPSEPADFLHEDLSLWSLNALSQAVSIKCSYATSFFLCTGLHRDNIKGDERGLNPRNISVSVWHRSSICL